MQSGSPGITQPFQVRVELALLFLDLQGFVTSGLICPGYVKLDSNFTWMKMTEKNQLQRVRGGGEFLSKMQVSGSQTLKKWLRARL